MLKKRLNGFLFPFLLISSLTTSALAQTADSVTEKMSGSLKAEQSAKTIN